MKKTNSNNYHWSCFFKRKARAVNQLVSDSSRLLPIENRLLSVKYSHRVLQVNDTLKLVPWLSRESVPEAFFEEKPSLEDSVLQSSAVDITVSESESSDGGVNYIYQEDIDRGTLLIDKPGKYLVMEDLVFNPNPVGTVIRNPLDAMALGLQVGDKLDASLAGRPLPSQLGYGDDQYDPKAFGIGFFSMLAITSNDVVLDLQGHTIQQSEEHALLQRFYSNIETAGAPFISDQGPHDFGPNGSKSAHDLSIKNGIIGLSSHHGIHGNGNSNVKIRNVDFIDFEVAAVALNGVDGLKITDSTASNRSDVPVLGFFSNARFLIPYIDYLASQDATNDGDGLIDSDLTLTVQGQIKSVFDIQKSLRDAINSVYDDIIVEGDNRIDQTSQYHQLFSNSTGLVEANSYGYLVGAVGVQVNGFPVSPEDGFQSPSKDVTIKNTHVLSLKSHIIEVPVLSNAEDGQEYPVIDPIGAAFQLRNNQNGVYSTLISQDGQSLNASADTTDVLNASYNGNVVADAQLILAKAIHQHQNNHELWFENSFLDISRNSIGIDIIDWAESAEPLSQLRESLDVDGGEDNGWIYNVDNMVHVNKGTIGFKLDALTGGVWRDVSASNIVSSGLPGFNGNYTSEEKGFVKQELGGYNGAAVRGFTFSGSADVSVKEVYIDNLSSLSGEVYGIQSPTPSTSIHLNQIDFGPSGLIASGDPAFGPNHSANAFDISGFA
ncbi:hypothetical protein SynSYN20_00336 [Synechococcus sp. SYN20]|uniref:hypothetical protein n=1 Tax=Synechococcus sp. SYN20 TaxID=1050714 RepID=UPI00164499E9|nr:hypothetical protein [Synechococcus sp. SYN20]QNJ24695.1 hypothetical protein SynSYN20_00336 [Synechococcus sp. SYN20]